jgi:hypothetical protein
VLMSLSGSCSSSSSSADYRGISQTPCEWSLLDAKSVSLKSAGSRTWSGTTCSGPRRSRKWR